MSDFSLVTPDLSTPEGARKALHDVHTAAKSLMEENGTLKGQLSALSTDLLAAKQALTELQRRPVDHAGESDVAMRQFVRDDGKVRVKGESTDDGGWAPGLFDAQKPVNEWHAKLLDLTEQRGIIRAIKRGQIEGGRSVTPHLDKQIAKHIATAGPEIKRAFGDISTAGAEWYPDVMLPMLEQTLKAERRVASLFGTMPMSAKNMLLPFLTTGLRPYLKGNVATDDPAQYTSSSISTAQRTIDAVGFAVRTQMDEEATEDSLIDSMSILRAELLGALVDGEEDAIINGCTSTHDDTGIAGWNIRSRWGTSGLGTASDHRRAWIGLRARAADVSNTADGSAVETTAGILTARASLTSPHGMAGRPVMIMSPEWYLIKLTGLAEVLTIDKLGPQATILTGQVASIAGMPVIVSEFVDNQYNASGVYDNSTKTKTGFLIVNPARFYIGQRRGSAVEVDKDITRGVYNMVATVREVFFTVDPAASTKNVRWNYNLTAS